MFKLNFEISANTYTSLNRYAKSLNLEIPVIMRFILVEQINLYKLRKGDFMSAYKHCKLREPHKTYDEYESESKPKIYNLVVSEYIHENVHYLKKELGIKTKILVNTLLLMGIKEKFKNHHTQHSTKYNSLSPSVQRYSIHMSKQFLSKLEEISEKAGIKISPLITLIIGNYLIEHYIEYDENTFIDDETGEEFTSLW